MVAGLAPVGPRRRKDVSHLAGQLFRHAIATLELRAASKQHYLASIRGAESVIVGVAAVCDGHLNEPSPPTLFEAARQSANGSCRRVPGVAASLAHAIEIVGATVS